MSDTFEILNRVLNERGYLVIHTNYELAPGFIIGESFYHDYVDSTGECAPITHPFVVIKETTREDRIEHLKACGIETTEHDVGRGRFYQVTTD